MNFNVHLLIDFWYKSSTEIVFKQSTFTDAIRHGEKKKGMLPDVFSLFFELSLYLINNKRIMNKLKKQKSQTQISDCKNHMDQIFVQPFSHAYWMFQTGTRECHVIQKEEAAFTKGGTTF